MDIPTDRFGSPRPTSFEPPSNVRARYWALGVTVAALLNCTTGLAGGKGGGGNGGGCSSYTPVVTTYNGRATDVDVHVTVLSVLNGTPLLDLHPIVSDTGDLGPTSAETQKQQDLLMINQTLPSTSDPQITLQADVLDALTKSMGNTTTSWSNIVSINLGVAAAALNVSAGVLQANAEAAEATLPSCPSGSGGSVSDSGNALITNLAISIGGTTLTLPVNPAPNTIIDVPGLAHIVLNEQKFASDGRWVVNAVDIHVGGALSPLTTVDVILAHADAAIAAACGATSTVCPPVCQPHDFVTGGGWITLSNGAKGTFGFNGGYKGGGGLQGHLNYIDHSNGTHVQGTDVTGYGGTGTARKVTYSCAINNAPDTCVLSVSDNGEPGAGVDAFALSANSYGATGPYITQGNIQLHHSSCPSTGGKNK